MIDRGERNRGREQEREKEGRKEEGRRKEGRKRRKEGERERNLSCQFFLRSDHTPVSQLALQRSPWTPHLSSDICL